MTVLDYSLKLGNLLRKTEEGTKLLKLKSSIEGSLDQWYGSSSRWYY